MVLMKRFLLYILIIIYLAFALLYSSQNIRVIIEACNLFVFVVMPSLLPFYLIGNMLLPYNYVSTHLYFFTKSFLHFESPLSCKIFLLSIIIGNPTSAILITNALDDNTLSESEANRLLKFTSFLSPLFIITICHQYILAIPKFSGIVIFSNILANLIIAFLTKSNNTTSNITSSNISLFTVLHNAPQIMLNILIIIIFVSLLKAPFLQSNSDIANYALSVLEVTTGIKGILESSSNSLLKALSVTFLSGFSGIAIILQTIAVISKKELNSSSFVLFRLFQAVLATFIAYITICLCTFF